jgi:hypothetical protein
MAADGVNEGMPTLLIQDGFKFFFYFNEHEPKHIHVMKGDGFAKVELKNLRVVKNFMKPRELKKAIEIVAQHQKKFERKWDEYFNKRENSSL